MVIRPVPGGKMRIHKTKLKIAMSALCVVMFWSFPIHGAPPNPAFDWIKALAGQWSGTFHWSGARSDEGSMEATYYLTGNGSAVVENLSIGGQPVMTSVYHLNGSELRMTHFCGAGNQPRLKATTIKPDKKIIRFDFVDITNLSTDARLSGHVDGLEMRLVDNNHITLEFSFKGAGKASLETINLTRS
ncbi:MAG: hypothetical protein ACRD3J_30725 [Thermoanaerobaculia bacterium]